MKFEDEYTSVKKAETGKITLTNEAYAVCKLIELLIIETRKSR